MPKNKVQFNLKNVHYAPMTDTTTPAWDTPVPVPGAVSLALEQQGSVSPFHADGIVYYQSASNSGYSGDLEMALFPDQMLEDIWGMTLTDTDNVLIENANVQAKSFALLFQIDGDATQQFYLLYNWHWHPVRASAARPTPIRWSPRPRRPLSRRRRCRTAR